MLREGSRPVSGGWIEFFPVEGTVGNLRSARVRADGSFEADGVAVGENLIRLVNAPVELSGATQLFGSFQSPIRRVIADRDGYADGCRPGRGGHSLPADEGAQASTRIRRTRGTRHDLDLSGIRRGRDRPIRGPAIWS